MRLFTFSGIHSLPIGTNQGGELVEFAKTLVRSWPTPDKPLYEGVPRRDHFQSFINLGCLLSSVGDALRLDGSPVLNEEASRLAPIHAEALIEEVARENPETVLFLAHSQGTNNLTWTLLHLAEVHPAFFKNRSIRCLLFDPKVGRNHMEQLFGLFERSTLQFLFLQSQNNLLGNQGLGIPKFITEFPHGDHIWVRGLGHGSIREWSSLNKPQHWLDLFGYQIYQRALGREVIRLRRETRTGQLGSMQMTRLNRWHSKYAKDHMFRDKLTEAILGFLKGDLSERFTSKER